MKLLPYKWFFLSVLLIVTCVFAGEFITRSLIERERAFTEEEANIPPSIEFMKRLVDEKSFKETEAFDFIEKRPHHIVALKHKSGKIVRSHPQNFDFEKEDVSLFELSDDYQVAFARPSGKRWKRGAPPPGARLIGFVAISSSILVGLGLSFIFLNLYLRKKSKQAEKVISLLKSGDLKARFKITDNDKDNLLMLRFNEMAEQIEILVQNLRDTEKARVSLLQELAHDLRTPVASLKNLQEMLLEKGHLMDDAKKEHIQKLAIKEVFYFEKLVEDLLFLSGVNDPKYDENFKDVNLTKLLQEEVAITNLNEIEVIFKQEEDIFVKGDSHLIQRLLKNALGNASRFAKTKIEISLQNTNETVDLTIKDDGPGIAENLIEKFGYKKFSREIREDNYISIGLGSVIMKKITELHEGTFAVKNTPPHGLEICFKFKRNS